MARLRPILPVLIYLISSQFGHAQGFASSTPMLQKQTDSTRQLPLPEASPARASITCRNPKVELSVKNLPDAAIFWWQNERGDKFFQKNLTVEQPGTFTFFVKNLTDGSLTSASSEITDARIFPKLTALGDEITCRQPVANLHLAALPPNLVFEWTGTQNFRSNKAAPTVNRAGFYHLVATEPTSGCTATATAEVVENKNFPKIKIAPPPPLDDLRRETWLDASGSSTGIEFVYLWWAANGAVPAPQDSTAALARVADTYTLLITNTLNGCISSQQVVLQESGEAARTGAVRFLPSAKISEKVVQTTAVASNDHQFSSSRVSSSDLFFSKKETSTSRRDFSDSQRLLDIFSKFLRKKQ